MSISSSTRKAGPYAGNDITVGLPFAFKVFSTADVRVVSTNPSGAETDLVLTTHYTVSLNSNQDSNPGGTVTMVTPPATGYYTTLTSNLANLQPVTLTNAGGFYPTTINDALDRSTIQIQQLAEQVSRSVKVGFSSTTTPDQLIASITASEAAAVSAAATAAAAAATFVTQANGSMAVVKGTTAQRDALPASGYFRFNTTLAQFEGYNGSAWGAIGGGGSGQMLGAAATKCLSYNAQTIDEDLTVATGTNAYAAGPITINTGRTVTVSDGCVLTVI